MDSEHTPGTWRTDPRLTTINDQGQEEYLVISDEYGPESIDPSYVATVGTWADALVVAGAPDLLVASAGLLKVLTELGEHTDIYGDLRPEVRYARAAIAKARGGA